jgi:Rhodopirellula transposase DDE domain
VHTRGPRSFRRPHCAQLTGTIIAVATSLPIDLNRQNATGSGCHQHTLYSTAKELLILADSGSSNGARAGEWKQGLQEIANKTGLRITVAHYPTGASKWNPVEHRLFGPISINWAGEPLVDYNTICQRIRHTRTRSGARCRVALDRRVWPTKAERKASGKTVAEPLTVKIRHSRVVPRLNYTIAPTSSPRK